MKNTKIRRPFVRHRQTPDEGDRHARSASPVFQELEPRKLLTTLVTFPNNPLYTNPVGETSVFTGFIALPMFVTPQNVTSLDASSVEERSVRVRISIMDTGPAPDDPLDRPTVTILDLDGNPLFPWLGQADGSTEISVSVATGDPDDPDNNDGFWGTEDDILVEGFGLDVGYTPGYTYLQTDKDLDGFLDPLDGTELIVPNNVFELSRVLARIEDDGDPPQMIWDEENVPDERTVLIPESGYWHFVYDPGSGAIIDKFRLPFAYDHPEYGVIPETDDRLSGGADAATVADDWYDPAIERINPDDGNSPTHMSRAIDPDVDATIQAHYNAQNANRQRHTIGTANDGIADFNNGIGRIILSNARATTRLSIVMIDEDGTILDPFQVPEHSDIGVDFDRDTFGIAATYQYDVLQAPGSGTIIVGNNTNADWTADLNSGAALLPAGFEGLGWINFKFEYDSDFPDRLPEGIWIVTPTITESAPFHPDFPDRFMRPDYIDEAGFIQDDTNESVGRISIDGSLFGTSRFPGALEYLHVGYLGGTVFADGEVNGIIAGGDAGFIDYSGYTDDTNNFIQVGRNLGSFIVGNRGSTEVYVLGELNEVEDRPFLANPAVLREYEDVIMGGNQLAYNGAFASTSIGFTMGPDEEFSILRNDTFGRAQYVGRLTSYIEVYGNMAKTDAIGNTDDVDMFAIAVDGQQEVRASLLNDSGAADYTGRLTLQDETGRILASRGADGTSGELLYSPTEAGVLYFVIDNAAPPPPGYRLIIRGYAPTTLGEVRTLGSLRYAISDLGVIMTEVGSIGSVRVGQDQEDVNNAYITSVAIHSAEHLWNITAGHGIGGFDPGTTFTSSEVILSAEGSIGSIIAGVGKPDADTVAMGGSILTTTITAGENIGKVVALTNEGGDWGDIGGISRNDAADTLLAATPITAGGSIGLIRADNRIWGANRLVPNGMTVEVGKGGIVDRIEAGVLLLDSEGETNRDLRAEVGVLGIVGSELEILKGVGGNVRFVRAPFVYGQGFEGADVLLTPEEIIDGLVFRSVDDSGAEFTIRVSAGQAAGGFTNSAARIVTAPIANSQGVALTRLIVNLQQGADLTIENNGGHVEIGDLIVMGSATDTGQEIRFTGSGQTDVYYLRAVGHFRTIENLTDGDMIAMDVGSADEIKIKGNLGHTTTVKYGPSKIGPELGVVQAAPSDEGVVEDGSARADWVLGEGDYAFDWTNGTNLNIDPAALSGTESEPLDGFLDGLTIRHTNLINTPNRILIDGAVGDVIVQNTIKDLRINADKSSEPGVFEGLYGEIYAWGNIERLQLGDGMIDPVIGPRPGTLIIAAGQIERIDITGEGHDIRGYVLGAGVQTYDNVREQNVDFGIGMLKVDGGSNIDTALIGGRSLDTFWNAGDGPSTDVDRILVTDGDVIDTRFRAINFGTISIKGGAWDNTSLRTTDDINWIRADEFKNTAGTGVLSNFIQGSGNINFIETNKMQGDIADLGVDVLGNIKKIRGFDFSGVEFEIDQKLDMLYAKGGIARSKVVAGQLGQVTAVDDIVRLTVSTAGQIKKFQSSKGSILLLDLTVSGPDGQITNLYAYNDLTGDISIGGNINKLQTKLGTIYADITTTGDGYIKTLQAGLDFLGSIDAEGYIKTFKAGRNIGSGDRITVQGDLTKLDARNGTVNAQFVIEGALRSKFSAQSWAPGTTLTVLDSIGTVDVDSTIDGAIISHSNGIKTVKLDGGLAAGSEISAYDGDIRTIQLSGDLDGDVYADEEIRTVKITTARDGTGGNLTGTISSDTDVRSVLVYTDATGATVHARAELVKLDVRGSATNAQFGAGQSVKAITVRGNATDTMFFSGIHSLGTDLVIGGLGLGADTYGQGSISKVDVLGNIDGAVFAAGVQATAGVNNSQFEQNSKSPSTGLSTLDRLTVKGTATGTNLVLADTEIGKVQISGVNRTVGDGLGGATLEIVNSDDPDTTGMTEIVSGTPATYTEADGDQVRINFRGNGQAWYAVDGSGNLTDLVLLGTDSRTNVEIDVVGGSGNGTAQLANAAVVSGDDASLSRFTLNGNIDGSDSFSLDGDIGTFDVGTVNTTGTILVSGEASRVQANSVLAGVFEVAVVNTFETRSGGFTGSWDGLEIGRFTVRGDALDATIYARNSIDSISISGALGSDPANEATHPSYVSTRGELSSLSAGSMTLARVSAGDELGKVSVTGNVVDSHILAGLSLGSDGTYGGSGTAGDQLSDGVLTSLSVRGNFIRSSVAAGVQRGRDGFYGSSDDIGALGVSEIKSITVNGTASGSNFGSQSYAFTSNGIMGKIRTGGQDFYNKGNLVEDGIDVSPEPVRVLRAEQRLEVTHYFVELDFSEDIDTSTLIDDENDPHVTAITVLDEDENIVSTTNYEVRYDEELRQATIDFDRSFTEQAAGVYTIILDGDVLKSVSGQGLDGDGDGEAGDDFASRAVVGDAGDRVTDSGTPWDPDGNPNTDNDVSFTAAVSMDYLLDNPLVEGIDPRRNFSLSLVDEIGNHPDQESLYFPGRMDVDLFEITLNAGEFLVVSTTENLPGSQFIGAVTLMTEVMGQYVPVAMYSDFFADAPRTSWPLPALDSGYYVGSTGTYWLAVTGLEMQSGALFIPPFIQVDIGDTSGVNMGGAPINPDSVANDVGRYQLNVMVFDDGDSGFDRGSNADLITGQDRTFAGDNGREGSIGYPETEFYDIDVYDISEVRVGPGIDGIWRTADDDIINELEAGTSVSITVTLEETGSDLGSLAEVGLFLLDDSPSLSGGMHVGSPGFAEGSTKDVSFDLVVPETGRYGVYLQGSIESNYTLTINVDTSTAGSSIARDHQNVLLELNGGFADWFGRFGVDMEGFGLTNLGFGEWEKEIKSLVVQEIEDDFNLMVDTDGDTVNDSGVDLRVSFNPSDFGDEEFTTVFLAGNLGEENYYGSLLSAPEHADIQNQNQSDEAIVFINTWIGIFAPGEGDAFAISLADTISMELGRLMGLRLAASPDSNPNIMHPARSAAADYYFEDAEQTLAGNWFLGKQNEVAFMDWLYDFKEF
ncbi:MAG: hypothetical protein D8M59_12530 [Planctomycetes bacterium]|nr:hypothetical protein [Planctomycetota bacterium]NOG53636.1 hypothetical protein [Planctomycetota bacterium]